jgi:hypothetical protein
MSSSLTSPEALLNEEPDVVSQEPSPASSASPASVLRRPVLPTKKLLKTGGLVLLVLSLAGSVAAIGVMANQMSALTIRVNSLDAAFRSGQMRQLSSTVAGLEKREQVQEKQLASLLSDLASVKADRETLAASLSDRDHKIQQQADDIRHYRDTVTQLEGRVTQLETGLQASAERLAEMDKARQEKKPAAPAVRAENAAPSGKPASVTPSGQTTKKGNRSVRRAATPAAPFVLTGIERRGGSTFAVVMPRGAAAVSQMKLLSPGDRTGDWVLRAVHGSSEAVFTISGEEVRVPVQ